MSQKDYAWAASSTRAGQSCEGQQPLGQCPQADREEVWQTLYALHSLYEVKLLDFFVSSFLFTPLECNSVSLVSACWLTGLGTPSRCLVRMISWNACKLS
jgi:hypothetical protein